MPLFWVKALFWKDMLLFMQPYVIQRSSSFTQARGPIMFPHYVKITIRTLWKQKLYASINMVGLAVGLALCMLLFLFVQHEWRYDRFHEHQDRIYRLTRIVGYCSILAIVIACLGLFGLSALTVAYRAKEISIRKVLGASVPGIVRSLSTEYVVLVALANLIAWPLAYLGVEQLLQFHAYRIDISWPLFLLAGSLSIALALLTVSYQSIRAALVDPAQTLRYE